MHAAVQDAWLRAIVQRPAKSRAGVDGGDAATPHVGETLHMLGLECVAVPLMAPVHKSVPKYAS